MKLQKIAGIMFIIFMVVAILILAKSIIIPLILAVIIWFLIKEIREFMDKSEWIKTNIKRWMKTIFATIVILVILGAASDLLIYNIDNIRKEIPAYSIKLEKIISMVEVNFNINVSEKLEDFNGEFDFQSLLGRLLDSISGVFSNAFMILLYLLFILMEESTFITKIKSIYKKKEDYDEVNLILKQIDFSIGKYLSIKTLVSIITGTLSFIVLFFLDIDFALFWAFFIFILNYIPSVGSLIATVFPAIIALIQYGDTDFTPFILVLVLVGAIQLIVGNLIEPKMMGNSLNISSLVVILSLSVWGLIWGIVGMVLSVPITVMMIIIFSHFKSTRGIAILLSEKGNINQIE